jgi:hypothetical protein
MHAKRTYPARKLFSWLGAAAALAVLPGCATVALTDLTPSSLPENPSEIYTFTLRAVPKSNTVVPDSIAAHLVVDGQIFDMKKSPVGGDIYEFDYQLPPGRDKLAYYYLADFHVQGNGTESAAQAYTDTLHATIVRRYVLSLEVTRGPVGARVGVFGRGFTQQDLVGFDGTAVRTVYLSPTALSFYVPALPSRKNYSVSLGGAAGNSQIGTFRIDPTNATVAPTSLNLAPGASQSLTFSIANPAPSGGLLLDVTTDAPESIIMPEVAVPEGQTSVTVTVQGGRPGGGNLYLKGYGDSDLTIPFTVAAPVPPAPPSTGK